jgi:macrolide transport system ATP-binding/permease protein
LQLLSIKNVTQSFGPRTILDAVSLRIQASERVGLVGANGAGKSTLLRVLTGELTPDSGQIERATGLTCGYLPQDAASQGCRTIHEILDESSRGLVSLERILRSLEDALTASHGDQLASVLLEYREATEAFERRGGYAASRRIETVLRGLGLDDLPRERRLGELSGGEQTRVLLAGLLVLKPDPLLLDEPTNNLDSRSSQWLEDYLTSYEGAVLAASHDRAFLNCAVTRIVEVDEYSHSLEEYVGDYEVYRGTKRRQRLQREQAYADQQEEIRDLRQAMRTTARRVGHHRPARDNDKLGHHGHGEFVERAISGNVRAVETRIRRLESETLQRPPGAMRLNPDLKPADIRSSEVIRLDHVCAKRGNKQVLSDVSFTLDSRARVAIVGENGAGKSTLLDLITGQLTPSAGSVFIAGGVRLGYLDQHSNLAYPDQSLLDAYLYGREGPREELINEIFHFGFFRADEIQTRVGSLSLGQRRKLQVARLIGQRANVLLLDEPTNHLSLDLVESLEQALSEFQGTILAASHDRRFIDRFGGEVWELKNGRLSPRM